MANLISSHSRNKDELYSAKVRDKNTIYARRRAAATTMAFGILGIVTLNSTVLDWAESWPLVVFYAALLTNTYFSVCSFASITPKRHMGQHLIDAILAACMALLAFNFNSILNFTIISTLLFIIATLKYIFLVKIAGYSKLLYMKIRIDTLGILFCFLAVIGTLLGYGQQISVIWSIVFVLANIYVLWWEPHYRLEAHYESR
ncbi:MAG: hypothetical protein Q7K44_04510 [Candidatus Liptonbacteria bacterium]|nr:hypothetical protein [Candidatus Liptonbacteria bacterium]